MKPEYLKNIPEDWEVKRNSLIFRERIERSSENEKLLSVSIQKGILPQDELSMKKDISNADKSNYKKVYVGDLAYNKMRMWQGAIGYSKYNGIVSPAYVIITPIIKNNSKYFHYLYRTPLYSKYSYQYSYGISLDQNSLRFSDFKIMYSPFPNYETQTRIADFLNKKTEAIDKYIKARKKKLILLKELKIRFIDKKINSSKISKKVKVKYLLNLISETVNSNFDYEYYVGLENIEKQTGKLIIPKEIKRFESTAKRFYKGNVIFSKLRPYLAKAFIAPDNAVGSTELLVFDVNNSQILNKFLLYYLLSFSFLDKINGSTYGTKMPRAEWNFIRELTISLPEIKEQKRIIKNVKEFSEKTNQAISNTKKEIELIQEYRTRLISDAVFGKIIK